MIHTVTRDPAATSRTPSVSPKGSGVGEDALFEEFSLTLDKIVTKLGKSDLYSAAEHALYPVATSKELPPRVKPTPTREPDQSSSPKEESSPQAAPEEKSDNGALPRESSPSRGEKGAPTNTEDAGDLPKTKAHDGDVPEDAVVVAVEPPTEEVPAAEEIPGGVEGAFDDAPPPELIAQATAAQVVSPALDDTAPSGENVATEIPVESTPQQVSGESVPVEVQSDPSLSVVPEGSPKPSHAHPAPAATPKPEGAATEVAQLPAEELVRTLLKGDENAPQQTLQRDLQRSDEAKMFERAMRAMLIASEATRAGSLFEKASQTTEVAQLIQALPKAMGGTERGAKITQVTPAQPLQFLELGNSNKADSSHGGESSRARSLPRTAEARTMERVENALKEVARSKDGKTISVRLDPPDLGTVKVDVSYRNDSLHARIVAETPQVGQFLREKAHELVAMLRKVGIEAERVSVSVGGSGQEGSAAHFEQFTEHHSPSHDKGQGQKRFGASMAGGGAAPEWTRKHVDDHWVA